MFHDVTDQGSGMLYVRTIWFLDFKRAMRKRARLNSGGISMMRTDKQVTTSKQIVIIDKEQKTTALMDLVFPSDGDF